MARSHRSVKAVDVPTIRATIENALDAAGLNRRTDPGNIEATIKQAFSAAGHGRKAYKQPATAAEHSGRQRRLSPEVGNSTLFENALDAITGTGQFVCRSFNNRAGMRAYKLYIPSACAEQSAAQVPLIVMLHGCTQSADDFAAGTRMNTLAEQHGFLVVYPEQAINANGSRCWNWFRSQDQHRDSGEPSLIAGITREVMAQYRVDEQKVFVAGLSAGAGMAVILGTTYPELYSAVGAHSGLAYGSAHDVPSAFAAMKNGTPRAGIVQRPAAPSRGNIRPTIVFHGDNDLTVSARNGEAILEQAIASCPEGVLLSEALLEVPASADRGYSRKIYSDRATVPLFEHWLIHGAGHAWSGGCASGTFTDARGPDASVEMLRFFHAQRCDTDTEVDPITFHALGHCGTG